MNCLTVEAGLEPTRRCSDCAGGMGIFRHASTSSYQTMPNGNRLDFAS
jgi:hypothetical protein